MAESCNECGWMPKPIPTNPIYEIKKSLREVGLEGGIRFDKNKEEKYMLEKLDLATMNKNISWDVTWNVIDDEMDTTHSLRLQKKPRKPWGFYEDWYEKIVLPRKFKGDEVIGFYIDLNTDFHFKVLGTDKGKAE